LRTTKVAGLLAGVFTLIYGVYLPGVFIPVIAGVLHHASPDVLNSLVLAVLDVVVYLFLGAQILRDQREFYVLAVFWTILGAALATFALSYRNDVLNLLSFLIVFFGTYCHVAVTKADVDVAVAKSLGLLAGILAMGQGLYVAFLTVSTYVFLRGGWLIPIPPNSQALLAPLLIVAAITAVVYTVSGAGMIRHNQEFFALIILWILVESTLALVNYSFVRSHFNIISIFILAFATYYYFAKTKTR